MTCKSNEQRKLAYYVMTQPLLSNCEKKLTENFDVTMSQCHNVTKLKLPPCNTARWELTKHRAEKPIVRMNEGHKKVRSEK